MPPFCPKEAHLIINSAEAWYSKGYHAVLRTLRPNEKIGKQEIRNQFYISSMAAVSSQSLFIFSLAPQIFTKCFFLGGGAGGWLLYQEFYRTQNRLFGQIFTRLGISHLLKLNSKPCGKNALQSYMLLLKHLC